jgi:hypothetical protein
MIKLGAALGGTQALGTSEADLTQGELGRATGDVALGATVGGIAGGAGGLVGSGLSKLSKVREASQEAAARAAGLKGRLVKEMSPEQIREMGETLLQKDVIPFSGNAEEIAKRAEALRETSGRGIGDITEQFDVAGIPSYDPAKAALDIGESSRAKVMEEAQPRLEQLLRMIKGSKAAPKGDLTNLQPKLTFKESQALKGKMGTEAFGKGGSEESKDVARLVGGKLDDIYLGRAEEAAKELGDESLLTQLKQLRGEYRTGLKASESAEALAKREMGATPKLSAREAITANLLPNDAKIALGLRKIAPAVESAPGQVLTGQTGQTATRLSALEAARQSGKLFTDKDDKRELLTLKDLMSASPDQLEEMVDVLEVKGYSQFSEQLRKALDVGGQEVQSTLSQLQQQPSFRKAISGE